MHMAVFIIITIFRMEQNYGFTKIGMQWMAS